MQTTSDPVIANIYSHMLYQLSYAEALLVAMPNHVDTEGFEPWTSRMRNGRCSTELCCCCLMHDLPIRCDRTQVVTGLDLKSSGPCPRRFEPCRSRFSRRQDDNHI